VEIDTSGYVMGEFLMYVGKPICYHYEMFHGGVLNYPTYDKEIYILVQFVKKWKHYLTGNKTFIHANHHPL
jgi:hypothetical protein